MLDFLQTATGKFWAPGTVLARREALSPRDDILNLGGT